MTSIPAIASKLTTDEAEAVSTATWMVSKRWRVRWKYAGPVMRGLVAHGLLDAGEHYPTNPSDHSSYLNELGLSVRTHLQKEASK